MDFKTLALKCKLPKGNYYIKDSSGKIYEVDSQTVELMINCGGNIKIIAKVPTAELYLKMVKTLKDLVKFGLQSDIDFSEFEDNIYELAQYAKCMLKHDIGEKIN